MAAAISGVMPPQAAVAKEVTIAAADVLKTEEGQKLIGTAGRVAEKAVGTYVDVAASTAHGVTSTVLEQKGRREVGEDVSAAASGLGGIVKGAVRSVRDAGITVGQDLGLYKSTDAKLNEAMNKARFRFADAYASNRSEKLSSAEKAYLKSIQASGVTITSEDQKKVDSLLDKLKKEAVVSPAAGGCGCGSWEGGCDTCGKHAKPYPAEVDGGCDTCGKHASPNPAAFVGGFLADAITGGNSEFTSSGSGGSSIDLAMMILAAIFIIALFYWVATGSNMTRKSTEKTKTIMLISGISILLVGSYKFLCI